LNWLVDYSLKCTIRAICLASMWDNIFLFVQGIFVREKSLAHRLAQVLLNKEKNEQWLNGTSIGFQHFSKKMLHNYCSMWDSVFLFASSPQKTNNRYNVFLDPNIFPRRCFTQLLLDVGQCVSRLLQVLQKQKIGKTCFWIPTCFQEDASQSLLDVGQCVSRLLQVLQKQIIGTLCFCLLFLYV